MSPPHSFIILERSNNQAGCGRDTKFKPLILGEIHAADDSCLVIVQLGEVKMDEFFASKPATNDSYLCVGPLTQLEAAEASESGLGDGLGYYIYVAEAGAAHL
jgi:hypothetical protein